MRTSEENKAVLRGSEASKNIIEFFLGKYGEAKILRFRHLEHFQQLEKAYIPPFQQPKFEIKSFICKHGIKPSSYMFHSKGEFGLPEGKGKIVLFILQISLLGANKEGTSSTETMFVIVLVNTALKLSKTLLEHLERG